MPGTSFGAVHVVKRRTWHRAIGLPAQHEEQQQPQEPKRCSQQEGLLRKSSQVDVCHLGL